MPVIRTRGGLPQWEADQANYFVTFRLADSLPRSVLRYFELKRQDILATARAAGRPLSPSEDCQLAELFSKKIESKLDAGAGRCFLARPDVARATVEALQHSDSIRFLLHAWTVMPNHVHVLFRLFKVHALAKVVHSWKSYSAKEANRLLRRSGEFWQREYYDPIVRSEGEFYRIRQYILENPEKAGLRNWPWVGVTAEPQ